MSTSGTTRRTLLALSVFVLDADVPFVVVVVALISKIPYAKPEKDGYEGETTSGISSNDSQYGKEKQKGRED